MTSPTQAPEQPRTHEPHPYIGGRDAALRALTAWRTERPGAPRVVILTGSPGTGCSRLLTGFLMLCDPEYRKGLDLDALDPATVPPDLPAPAVPGVAGLTAAQTLWLLADHYGLSATRTADIFPELGQLPLSGRPVTIVVADVDRAGPVRGTGEPARVVRDALKPLAAVESLRLLADVPREFAVELAEGLPPGVAQIIDLDAPEWADPEGLVLQAEALLNPQFGAPELPFTTEPDARRALAEMIARSAGDGAGSRLTVHLAVQSILMHPEGFDPADASQLPDSVGEVLDLHAQRLGVHPRTLRQILAPLALAEGDGLPVHLLTPLASAVAGRDISEDMAQGMLLVAPFIRPVERAGEGIPEDERTLLGLPHPGIGEAVRAGIPDIPGAQTRIAMELLEAVPDQDWGKAGAYVRDDIAGHTLEAGLLPRLLTDPGLFAHADPVRLRAAVEAVPPEQLGAPARTYLRTAPLLTRTQAPALLRAALLETAFVEDGLPEYAAVLRRLVPELPWHTLWSAPVAGVDAVTVGTLPPSTAASDGAAETAPLAVAVCTVPQGTPGSSPLQADDPKAPALLVQDLATGSVIDADPTRVLRPSDDERATGPLGFSRGADYVRVWHRGEQKGDEKIVTALISATPFTGTDLSPDGILVVATESGVKALRIRPAQPYATTARRSVPDPRAAEPEPEPAQAPEPQPAAAQAPQAPGPDAHPTA
ncbi:ATP-binding protein [Streptomyces sp. P9-2B-2]|uniref:ATP-binding protein n=1 Tax=Streptomyces sp. P9-2B-2 TaxID=3057114 RepID=UPI0025B41991|nr:ATP-binding protein [Streptomyces sp. P9-2B-2]WJY41304.1 ATP-binding protein [Streptomyces sp. P9-2B-2]